MNSKSSLWMAVLAFIGLAGSFSGHLHAQSQGYEIEYLDSWPVTSKIKFLRVRITPVAGASTEDLDFHIVSKSTSGSGEGIAVTTVIPIRKGDTVATGELYIPVVGYRHIIHAELDGDHKYDRGDFAKREYNSNYFTSSISSVNGAAPLFVFISSEIISDESVKFTARNRFVPTDMPTYKPLETTVNFPSFADLDPWYADGSSGAFGERTAMNLNGFSAPFVAAMSFESLPSKWFGYQGLGLVMITFEDLKLIAKKHPAKLLAIERWVSASGRLVVLHCGNRLEKADEALKLLGDSNPEVRQNRSATYLSAAIDLSEVAAARRLVENEQRSSKPAYFQLSQSRMIQAFEGQKIKFSSRKDTFKNALDTATARDFLAVDFDLGQVVFVSDQGSDWATEETNVDRWGNLGVFLNETHRHISDRNGVLNDNIVRKLGFPEFAEPPRYVFEFAIVAYLLAVGPIAFFFLKRKRKLNLMFIIVPAISALFCTTILAYAVFAEGFDTRVNLFTVTVLHQRSGRQSTSAVAHVYSGMTPSAYQFEGPAYGLVNLPRGSRLQRVDWSDSKQLLSGGEVRARTGHQLFSRSSSETQNRLLFSFRNEGSSAKATVRNQFDSKVAALTFYSEDCQQDEAWYCGPIEVDETVEAKIMKLDDIAATIKATIEQRGKTTVYASKQVRLSRTTRNSSTRTEESDIATTLDSLWKLRSINVRHAVARNEGRGYLAVTDQPIDFDMPIENAKVESAIHAVFGIR